MIYIQQSGNNVWRVNDYTFSHAHMDIRKINMTVKHPSMHVDGSAPDVADFADCYVIYDNERYDIASIKPTGSKDNTSLDYTYELTFKGAEEELTRRKVRNLALVGVDSFISQGTSFSIYASLPQFQQLLQNNLTYYFGDEWTINLSATSTDSVRVDVSNTNLFELLSKTYEYFGLRWKVEGKTITIGYEPEQIEHIFNYGKAGGLVRITRTGQDTSIVNRLTGGGGTRNLPQNYFTEAYTDFAPDPNPINGNVNIKNLMPSVFRDSVIAGNLPYIDYVEDEASIALNGVREDALAPNEDIYPSIAGVEVDGLGRIDEIIGSTIPIANKPDDENYSPTFDIWVKDIGFDLADKKYTATQDAKISFTTGALAGYEFTILSKGKRTEGSTVKDKEVFADTTKSDKGVNSAYRITLIKSDEELEAGKYMMPNTSLYPVAGDAFVIYDIEMPHVYVKYAEDRLQRWLEAQLEELKVEKPTYAIEPMDSFFAEPIVEYDGKTIQSKLKAGNKIYIQNSKLTDVKEELHINQLTIQYGGLLPKYVFTVTDKVQVNGSAVGRLQSQLDAVVSRQLLTEKEIEAIMSGFSTKFLSKVKPDTAQQFVQFLKGISVEELATLAQGLEIGDYTPGFLGGGGAFKMNNGISELEVDKLTVRMIATFFEIVVSKLRHINGGLVLSRGSMTCNRVVEDADSYQCFFERGDNNEISNTFVVNDQARCQVFNAGNQKFYWRLVTAVGDDWIKLSKTVGIGDSIPTAGDDIVQLGYQGKDLDHVKRLNAQIIDESGISQYVEIDNFTLEGKRRNFISADGTGSQFTGKVSFKNAGVDYDLSDWAFGVESDIQDAESAANNADLKAQQAIADAEANVATINTEVGKLQAQLDGEVSNWFYAYSPTLANYPASDWNTNILKDRHIGDTFTNTEPAPAENAGKSWRFVKSGSVYSWTLIADSDAVKALLEASKAQATADGKSTTHLFQPTNYKLGDMWVLNADQTVNGTAYKQGELLTATQDSETFVQAHWLKRIRYTDDTAINELEIGGRNLILNSNDWTKLGIYTARGVTSFKETVDGESVLRVVYDGTTDSPYLRFSGIIKELGIQTFSVEAKLIAGEGKLNLQINDLGTTIHTLTEEWVRYNVTYDNNRVTEVYNFVNMYPLLGTGTYSFYLRLPKLEKGNKATDWTPAPEDVQAEIDAAVIKATYWSIKASTPVIYKDANSATASGVHTPVTVTGELRSGTTTTQGGFISIQPNGGVESTATASPRTIAPTNTEGKTSYTVRLYEKADKAKLLDTMTIPVVFKGASGVNAINASLSNEADVLPASPEGVVSDYAGSGTITRVFEGATELTYGTGNGQFQVSVSGSGITAGTPTTVGNTRVYGVASNMTSDNATITFTISGKTSSGASFSLTKVQAFAKSRVGQKGSDGKSITLVDVQYAVNTSSTTPPIETSSLWKTLAGTLTGSQQLWTRTKTTYSSGDPTYSTPANITPKIGGAGADGNSITSITEWYYLSTSKTELTGGSWSTTPWTWEQGMFIWTKTVFTYSKTDDTETLPIVSSEWEAIDSIEIGGRNLILNSNDWTKLGIYTARGVTAFKETIDGESVLRVVYDGATASPYLRLSNIIKDLGVQTFSVEAKLIAGDGGLKLQINDRGSAILTFTEKWVRYNITNDNDIVTEVYNFVNMYPILGTGAYSFYLRLPKLEKGNKATDWTPAPEDVQASIDKAQADANVSLAKTKGFTKIGDQSFEDGLIFTSLMKLLDAGNESQEMAGISGIAGDNKEYPAFWAGGTYDEAISGVAKAIDRHDGSGHRAGGDISWATGEPTRFRGTIEVLSSIGMIGVSDNGIFTSGGQITDGILETISELAQPYSVIITPQSSWSDSYTAGRIGEAHAYTQDIVVAQDSSIEFWVSFSRTYTGWNETYDVYIEDVNSGVLDYTRRSFSSSISFAGGNYKMSVMAGTYKIHAKLRGTGGAQTGQVLSVALSGKNNTTNIVTVGFKHKTKIGTDGFYSYWGVDKYIYYRKGTDGQPSEFYIKGLPTSPSGLPAGSGRVWRDSDGTLKSV